MLHRPSPVPADGVPPLPADLAPHAAARALVDGHRFRLTRSWRDGLPVLDALAEALPPPPPEAPRPVARAARQRWHDVSAGLLAPVERGRIALRDAPPLSLLAELYPGAGLLHLPVETLRALGRADRRYRDGVRFTVLGHALHPFWGVYAPTRTDHLELFATWLAGWNGPRDRAIDVGTGSGVLAFLLARSGFSEVLATDANPNACESVRRDVVRRPEPPPIRTWHGDLLPTAGPPADVIVFNPPWLVGEVDSTLDAALHASDVDLFPRFIDRALDRLAPDGRIVVVFSNLIELVQPDHAHPVRAALAAGRVREVQLLRRKTKPQPGPDGRRRRTRERLEIWELART